MSVCVCEREREEEEVEEEEEEEYLIEDQSVETHEFEVLTH